MMSQPNNDRVRFSASVTTATKAFAKSKPWQGTIEERVQKFQTFHSALCDAMELENVDLMIDEANLFGGRGASGMSCLGFLDENGVLTHVETARPVIMLTGKLSVVTYLFLVGRALGYERTDAMTFATELFKQRFPRSAAAVQTRNGMLVRDDE